MNNNNFTGNYVIIDDVPDFSKENIIAQYHTHPVGHGPNSKDVKWMQNNRIQVFVVTSSNLWKASYNVSPTGTMDPTQIIDGVKTYGYQTKW